MTKAQFNAELSAASTLKERFVWLLYLGIVFFLLYGSANQYAAITATDRAFVMGWEKQIPFVEAFIVPYMSSDVLFAIAFLLPQTRQNVKILALRNFFAIIISVLVFVLWPMKFTFTKPPVDNFLFEMLKMDLPYNQLPSLHVSLAVILWASMKHTIHATWIKAILFIWLILIVLSTLLVYQHHFIDIPTGFAVGVLVVYLFNEKRANYFTNSFTTPRHIKIGLYYLVFAIGLMILAFKLSSLFVLYLFVSVFAVSAIYAFGLNEFLLTKNRYLNVLQRLILLPYFIGSHLSWRYYQRKIPFLSQLNERIYFGRQANNKEYAQLKQLGITHIINLCPELIFNRSEIAQQRFNFLDLTMQSPVQISTVIEAIESSLTNDNDKVYIHCKLGMSRTILVISAYLLQQGKTNEQISAFLQQTRPFYVKSKYMQINLQLFVRSLPIKLD